MGALTSYLRRGNDTYSFYLPNFDNQIDAHVKKKQKISSLMPQSNNSIAFRFNQYPEPENRIPREIHAPCRGQKLGFNSNFSSLSSSRSDNDNRVCEKGGVFDNVGEMHAPCRGHGLGFNGNSTSTSNRSDNRVWGNMGLFDKVGEELFLKFKWAGKCAVESLRFFKKSEEVVDAGEESADYQDSVSEVIDVVKEGDCEGVEFVENRRENEEMGKEVEDASKGLKTLLLVSGDDDVLELPVHKKLLESAGRRNHRLGRLSSEIELNEKRLARFQLDRPVEKPDEKGVFEDLLCKAFVPLTDEEKDEVYNAFSSYNRRKVLITHENSNIKITGEVLQCLRPGEWLNDEVINVYFELLKEREKREPKKFLKCHFFNTFFYKKLLGGKSGYDFKSVRRWTTQKKLGYGLSECDMIFVPIHKQVHWCLVVINNKDKKFQYLDSLRGVDYKVLRVLALYFADEVKDKNGVDIDVDSWTQEHVEDIPMQKNGWDCGMFMIKYADFYSKGLGLCFNQEHVPYFRLRTTKEILKLEAE